MRILIHSREAISEPELLWIRQVQLQLKRLLDAGRTRLTPLSYDAWQAARRHWKALVQDACPELKQAQGQPFSARLLGETAYDGFRVQRIVLEAMPGWKIGVDLFLPMGDGPFTPVVMPCGHGPKWQDDHQIAPQVLARNGFAAALFDSPMFGERGCGNDHFIQGAQSQMIGLWSNFFFLLDPIRVADYLQTRADIHFTHGMGVTGVSGGGYATLYMAQYDERVRAIAPVCSVTPLESFPIHGLYTGCPENHVRGQALLGMDYDDLLALTAPLPCLVIGGMQDTMFKPEYMEHSVQKAQAVYELSGAADHLASYYEECPHKYTAGMAQQTARWFRRWLLGETPELLDDRVQILPEEALNCGTQDTSEGMLQYICREVAHLRKARKVDVSNETLCRLLTVCGPTQPVDVEVVPPRTEWVVEGFERKVLHSAGQLPLPVLELQSLDAPAGTLVCFSDEGKFAPLRQRTGFFRTLRRVVSADLRGFGELEPESPEYDVYGWCSIDRALADLLWLSGETGMGQQTRDALRVLEAVAEDEVVVYGKGEAALPALFAGLLCERVTHIVLENCLCSFDALASAPAPDWNRFHYLPDVLHYFDLPELLAGRADKEFLLINPRDTGKERLTEVEATGLYRIDVQNITLKVDNGRTTSAKIVSQWLASRQLTAETV